MDQQQKSVWDGSLKAFSGRNAVFNATMFTKTKEIKFMKNNKKKYCEQLTIQESDILYHIFLEPFVNQRVLSEASGHSLGVVNRSLKRLTADGYLDDHVCLTEKSKDLFRARAPRNAIILAAGLGMRMVPINFTTPKALVEVNGERLIDRLIKQLHEAGITDITVVVGFMKDSFEYLMDEFGVRLSYAPDYASTNNIHSLLTAIDDVSNTYIVPCDIWCEKNPFRRNELYSWYMVSDAVVENSDVRVNRKTELVKTAQAADGNSMIGISYLTGTKAATVRERIKEFAGDASYNGKFWEEALYTDDRMIVPARVVPSTEVVEINTFEQLRELDSASNQLKSDELHIIAEALKCREEDITDIKVMKKGTINSSFLFRVGKGTCAGKYIMRIPREGADLLIDWQAEATVYEAISGLAFCDDPVYMNPSNGYKITRYIERVHCCNPEKMDEVRSCIRKLRRFHDYKINGKKLVVPHTFDLFERIDYYECLWNGHPSVYRDYEKTKRNCFLLKPFIERHSEPFQLTHIDAVPDNFLFDPNVDGELSIQLTDWEYAGMQDRHVDIAMFAIYSQYKKDRIDELIDIYFEEDGGCNPMTRTKIYCYIAVCGLIWSNWCEYERNQGTEFGEYSLYQYRYSKDFFRYAKELMNEIGEPIREGEGIESR